MPITSKREYAPQLYLEGPESRKAIREALARERRARYRRLGRPPEGERSGQTLGRALSVNAYVRRTQERHGTSSLSLMGGAVDLGGEDRRVRRPRPNRQK